MPGQLHVVRAILICAAIHLVTGTAGKSIPCTSNAKVVRLVTRGKKSLDGSIIIGNNVVLYIASLNREIKSLSKISVRLWRIMYYYLLSTDLSTHRNIKIQLIFNYAGLLHNI